MLKTLSLIFATLVGVGASSPAALAQGNNFTGAWNCQMAYSELDARGNRTSGFVRQFAMAIYPNGRYEARGTEGGASGYMQFVSSGSWQVSEGFLFARGPMQTNSYGIAPVFAFAGQIRADGTLGYTYEQQDPSGRYVMNRSNYLCQRQR